MACAAEDICSLILPWREVKGGKNGREDGGKSSDEKGWEMAKKRR